MAEKRVDATDAFPGGYGERIDAMNDERFDDNMEFGEEHFGEVEEVRKEELGFESEGVKEMPVDRLSDLPDSQLVHILSFLDVKEAIITSVLSKRWKSLWVEVPSLEFREYFFEYNEGPVPKFVSWVNRTLRIRKGVYLEKFVVNMNNYEEEFASDVDSWVEYAVKNEVKELMLWMYSYTCYKPPEKMFSCSSVMNLELGRCTIPSESTIKWKSLTRLSLNDAKLSQRLIDEILSNCPVLNTLELEFCRGFHRLEINSRCLIHLRLHEHEIGPEDETVEISAPYVRDLDIKMFPQGNKWQIKNISSVCEASIDFFEHDDIFPDEVMSNAIEFLDMFKQVKKLYIGRHCFEFVLEMAMNDWQLPQLRVQNLTLACRGDYELSIYVIIAMLESSPLLETLLFDGCNTYGNTIYLDPDEEVDLDGELLHLKTIRVNGFADPTGEPLLKLARSLLRKAPVLEEMTIVIDVKDTSDFCNFAQTLLTYPRSSAKARIYLNYHHK